MRSSRLLVSSLIAAFVLASPVPAQQLAANLPDVVGIRPGMSPQDAYNILKARANGSKIGIAQTMIEGVQQPVVVLMSLQVMGSSPREEITVYLTFPPQKQVVWSVARTLTFETGKEPTRASLLDGLRQKYGPETGHSTAGLFWSFTEDGQRPNATQVIQDGCGNRGYLSQVSDFQNPQPSFAYQYMEASPKCDRYVAVRAEVGNAGTATGALSNYVTVGLTDTALALRSRDAWKALASGVDVQRKQQEMDKAKQQQAPTF
jgi:hypothetical protein